MKVAHDVIAHHGPVRLVGVEVEDARLFVIDPDDGVIMIGHGGAPQAWRLDPTAPVKAAL